MRFIRTLLLCAAGLLAAATEAGRVTSHGLDIHYRVAGKGAPLLLLGGGPGDAADRYTELFELLSRSARCILVEQRGTGKSSPKIKDASTLNVALTLDDFEAIRTKLGLSRWSVLGFSYGGYLASLYAHTFPGSIDSLVLMGSIGLNWDGLQVFEDNVLSRLWASDLEHLQQWSAPARMKADPQHAITETIRAKMPGYFYDRTKGLMAAQAVKPSDFNFELGDWIYQDTVKKGFDLANQPKRFQGSVLILHGRQDPTGESVPMDLAKHYPKARLRFLERCGHYSWLEQPDQVLAAVTEFLVPSQHTDSLGHAWTLVPAGSFQMGSPEGVGKPDERPKHRVTLSRPFLLGTTPVTVRQFRRFVELTGYRTEAERGQGAWIWDSNRKWVRTMDASWRAPGFPQEEDHPAVCVSWNDAQAYCAWLGTQLSTVCRLPTEAEFEYALRAGTRTPWFFGAEAKGFESFGWPQPLTPLGFPTHPVGRKRPNPWGLYDLVGNVWQWCEDWFSENAYPKESALDPEGPVSGEARVNRGGMGDDPEAWRSAARDALPPGENYSNQGFRVVRELVRTITAP